MTPIPSGLLFSPTRAIVGPVAELASAKIAPPLFGAVLSTQKVIGNGKSVVPVVLVLMTCTGQTGVVVPIPILPSGD
jgi:hypothetical protein